MDARKTRPKRASALTDPEGDARLRRLTAMMDQMMRVLPQMIRNAPSGAAGRLPPQQMMLLALVQSQGPMSVMGLRGLIGGAQSSLSELISRMEKAGFIEKAPAPGDQRAILVSATPAGRRVLQQQKAKMEASHRAILARLEVADQERFVRAMETMMALMARAYSVGPMSG